MSRALFVVSEEGYWGEECAEPLTTLDSAGFDITVATPSGSPPVLDERSADPDEVGEETAEFVRDVHENDDRLNDPEPLAAVEADGYDAVVFPGGHGTAWDVNQDRDARRLLRNAVAGDDGKALVVCHAVGILAFTYEAPRASEDASGGEPRARRENDGGEFLVDGRDVTGFPNAWEEGIVDDYDRMPDGRKLPYWVEDEVEAAGGDWDAELDADTSVTVDGDLVTARGPESSAAAADALLDELD
ncbi:DJ-1/PfpI family protein [Salarchaeum japonicum]|uniref:DJ-1/PfpI family protein n=1 Tax=Salarchaeum japonicum TaxID=555573 RepID=A0AAV3T4J9_9EURY|nr:DJ-1/PfpI family protein [Salarchaeum japonicum]